MRIVILVLLLLLPALAVTDEESRLLTKLTSYYKLVGMNEKATWLDGEVKAGRVRFGTFTGKEAATAASVHMRTGVITINETTLRDNTFRNLVDLGNTLAHERVHQGQSYLGWAVETYKQDLGQGNEYEVAGWAESLRVARQAAIALKKRVSQAKSAREREVAGRQLKHAVDSWQNLADDWKKATKDYGTFGPRDFVDPDGLPMTLEEMDKERKTLSKLALDAIVTSKAMNSTSYTGKYRGSLSGGASGSFAFDVRADQSVVGRIKGTHKSGPFEGSLEGRVNVDGLIRGSVFGHLTMGKRAYKFTGDFSGSVSRSGASGRWTAGAEKMWPSGSWSVNRL